MNHITYQSWRDSERCPSRCRSRCAGRAATRRAAPPSYRRLPRALPSSRTCPGAECGRAARRGTSITTMCDRHTPPPPPAPPAPPPVGAKEPTLQTTRQREQRGKGARKKMRLPPLQSRERRVSHVLVRVVARCGAGARRDALKAEVQRHRFRPAAVPGGLPAVFSRGWFSRAAFTPPSSPVPRAHRAGGAN